MLLLLISEVNNGTVNMIDDGRNDVLVARQPTSLLVFGEFSFVLLMVCGVASMLLEAHIATKIMKM